MPISSNRRQRVIEFATPKINDLVVVERVDASKNVGSVAAADDTDYGTAHPDTSRFPNFKLSLIKNDDDEQGQFQLWYYIKDREDQDKYNWQFQSGGGGQGSNSPRYNTVVRTYVLPRYGSGISGAIDGETKGINVFDEDEPLLNSTMPATIHDPFGGGLGSTTTPDTSYILFEKRQDRSGDEFLDTLYVVEERMYVKKVSIRRVDSDAEFPYNNPANGEAVPYGGLISKETLFHKDEDIYATVNFLDSDTTSPDPQEGVQDTTTIVYGGDDNQKEAEYVFTKSDVYYNYNDGSGAKNYNFWGVDALGILREGRQLSDNWYALVERQVIQKNVSTGLVATYFTYQNYAWPAVFSQLYTQIWPKRNGSSERIVYPQFKREAYNGPTKMKVELYWRKSAFDEPTGAGTNTRLTRVQPMEPLPMQFVTPMYRVAVKPSLHGDVEHYYTTGTEDPEWAFVNYTSKWIATNYVDWCQLEGEAAGDSIVISDDQKPYRGGYLRTKVTAYKPHTGRTAFDSDQGAPEPNPA